MTWRLHLCPLPKTVRLHEHLYVRMFMTRPETGKIDFSACLLWIIMYIYPVSRRRSSLSLLCMVLHAHTRTWDVATSDAGMEGHTWLRGRSPSFSEPTTAIDNYYRRQGTRGDDNGLPAATLQEMDASAFNRHNTVIIHMTVRITTRNRRLGHYQPFTLPQYHTSL